MDDVIGILMNYGPGVCREESARYVSGASLYLYQGWGLLGVVGARVDGESLSGYFGRSFAGGRPSFADWTLVLGVGTIGELVRVPGTGGKAHGLDLDLSAGQRDAQQLALYIP